MSLTTFSKFYFGHTVTQLNGSIDFDEGGSEIQASLNPGDYSLEEYLAEVKRAMDSVGSLTYTVGVNRATRIITISSTSNFTLRAGTGTRVGTGAWAMLGYTATNKTGASTYAAQNGTGSAYLPQAIVTDHVPAESNLEQNDAAVNESASGDIQVILFGQTRKIQMNIRLATNKTVRAEQRIIETQANGVDNLRAFMEYLVTKAKFEFMPDRSNANSFYKVLLDRTEQNRNGTVYELKEMKNAPGYFETGKLTLRVVE